MVQDDSVSAVPPESPHSHQHQHILDDPDFQNLARRKDTISTTLTIVTFVLYFAFVLLIAFAPQLLAGRLSRGITLGIPFGIGIIIVCWILTGIYVRWANGPYDDMVARVKKKLTD